MSSVTYHRPYSPDSLVGIVPHYKEMWCTVHFSSLHLINIYTNKIYTFIYNVLQINVKMEMCNMRVDILELHLIPTVSQYLIRGRLTTLKD